MCQNFVSLQKNSYFNTEISIDMILIQNSTVQWSVISDKVLIASTLYACCPVLWGTHIMVSLYWLPAVFLLSTLQGVSSVPATVQ